MVFDVVGHFVLTLRGCLTAFEICACNDVQVFFQIVGGNVFGKWTRVRYF